MLPEDLRTDVGELLADLRTCDPLYHHHLADRLARVLDAAATELHATIRREVSLADWNTFQADVIGATAMIQGWEGDPAPWAAGFSTHFRDRLARAQAAQSVLRRLIDYAWSAPLYTERDS